MLGDTRIDTWNIIADHLQGSFTKRYKHTIGCDIGIIDVQLPYDRVTLSIWDIASSERFRFFRSSFFRGASCAILAFDLTRHHSFNPTLINLITEIYTNLGAVPIILIGCNALREDLRQISREEIEQLCERMAHVVYFEIAHDPNQMVSVFETAAGLILNHLGYDEVDRRIAFEWKQKQLETIMSVLDDLDFHVNDKDEVEIFTHHGLFSINILNGSVTFEPIICGKCENYSCHYKKRPRRKSLCIVSGGHGWSNQELYDHELLILAKIMAIADDNLPNHVLNQMAEVAVCKDFSGEPRNLPVYDVVLPEPEPLPEETHPIFSENIYATDDLDAHLTPAEARALLRNHHIQFMSGRLPYSVYIRIKERFIKIITPI